MSASESPSECIHGFEGTQCDLCFPTEAPPQRRTVARAPVRAPRVPRRESVPTPPAIVPRETRVYLVVAIDTLSTILDRGTVVPEETLQGSLFSDLGQELRTSAPVMERAATSYVPFALEPDSDPWTQIRRGAGESHWATRARSLAPADFVVLVSTLGALGEGVVVSDGDAAGTWTRFAIGDDDIRRLLARLRDDPSQRAAAEVLVPGSVPFSAVQLMGVAHEPAKERVRGLLKDTGATTKVAVYPPWFAPT